MKKKKVLFISSTGGHLSELLQLSPLFEKYDNYIADRTTKLQIRLTGAPAYNNGVLAMDKKKNKM